jgi:hypothetical protein
MFGRRRPLRCAGRASEVTSHGRPAHLKRQFSPLEDMRLSKVVSWLGPESWTVVAARMAGRSARQCRERWMAYINPNLTDSPMPPAEDTLLDAKHSELGPKWQQIAAFLPRTRQKLPQKSLDLQAEEVPGGARAAEAAARRAGLLHQHRRRGFQRRGERGDLLAVRRRRNSLNSPRNVVGIAESR